MKYSKRKDKYCCEVLNDNFHEIDDRLNDLEGGSTGGNSYEIGSGLKLSEDNTLSVDVAQDFNGDNTRPVEAGLMETMIGNVEILLQTI